MAINSSVADTALEPLTSNVMTKPEHGIQI